MSALELVGGITLIIAIVFVFVCGGVFIAGAIEHKKQSKKCPQCRKTVGWFDDYCRHCGNKLR